MKNSSYAKIAEGETRIIVGTAEIAANTLPVVDEAAEAFEIGDDLKIGFDVGKDGVDLNLKMKPGWNVDQRLAATTKAEALTKAETRVVKNPQRMSNTRGRFIEAGGMVKKSEDVDHIVDLQLGGKDKMSNLKGLDRSVNRSMGKQINNKIKNLPKDTKINNVKIELNEKKISYK